MGKIPSIEEKSISKIIEQLKKEDEMTDIRLMLNEREQTHGLYHETAKLSQSLKDVMRSQKGWTKMNDGQREALEMIASKIARAICGDASHRDHWDDVSGYAKLGLDSIPSNLASIHRDIAK
jgi:hypothetical protein